MTELTGNEIDFTTLIVREKTRLSEERDQLRQEAQQIEDKIAAVNRELGAIEVYEKVKAGVMQGKSPTLALPRPAKNPTSSRKARAGSRRESLLQLIRSESAGLNRGEILEKLGLRGNKSGEMSVSNALTALTKSNQLRREGGKYLPVQ